MKFGDTVSDGIHPRDIWSALNTIAYFILDGNIKLSGGNDCFKKLAKQKSGVGIVYAGPGLFIQPREDIHTFGNKSGDITDTGPVENVHISSRQHDRRGETTNALVLKERPQCHIAGDLSLDFTGTKHAPADRERLLCHRGRLRDAGFEIPDPIHREELWLMDRSGNFAASITMFDHMWPCDGCYESLCRREWPSPEMYRKGNNRCNGITHVIPRMKAKGVTPAVPAFECARLLVTKYNRAGWSPTDGWPMKRTKKLLDVRMTIRDWYHLSEATSLRVRWLVVVFCTVPCLGERLDKRGASFVPCTGDAGLQLGTHARVERNTCKSLLYEESDQGVIDLFTAEKVRFEKDHNGIIHVLRVPEGYNDRIPEGVDGYLCLG